MTLGEQFLAAVSGAQAQRPRQLGLLPDVLAQSCVTVLGVSAAGISMMVEDLRVPLGCSGDDAARAEQLQVTLGHGPCLDALGAERPQVFDQGAMAARWPDYYGQVLAQTPFRAIASLPLRPVAVPVVGALDLYSTNPDGMDSLAIDEINGAITGTIADYLFDGSSAALRQGTSLPMWLGSEAVSNRMDVWIAVGTLMELANLSKGAALEALRSYAGRHRTSVDDVAHQIAEDELRPEHLLG